MKPDVRVTAYGEPFGFSSRSAAEVKGHMSAQLCTHMNWISSDSSFNLLAVSRRESRQNRYLCLLFVYNPLQKAEFRHWSCLQVLTSDVLVHRVPSSKLAQSWILIWKVATLVAISIEFPRRQKTRKHGEALASGCLLLQRKERMTRETNPPISVLVIHEFWVAGRGRVF